MHHIIYNHQRKLTIVLNNNNNNNNNIDSENLEIELQQSNAKYKVNNIILCKKAEQNKDWIFPRTQ